MLWVEMTCEVFIPLNDIATEGYECGRPGKYDERLEMVVCEEHKQELVDFNAAGHPPKGIATSTRRLRGAA
jgi:hypothetical protein